jgi:hypothetical protein
MLGLGALAGMGKDPGFEGKWVLDGSSPRPANGPENLVQQIKIKGSDIEIESGWREPAGGVAPLTLLGIMTSKLKLTSDGQQANNQIGPFQQASRTTVNGNKMITDWTAQMEKSRVEGQWIRTLSDDGRRMTLHIKNSSGETTLHFLRK